MITQPISHFRDVDRPDQVTQLGHGQPCITAGVDAPERFEIHVHVQRQAVEGPAVANAQAQEAIFAPPT